MFITQAVTLFCRYACIQCTQYIVPSITQMYMYTTYRNVYSIYYYVSKSESDLKMNGDKLSLCGIISNFLEHEHHKRIVLLHNLIILLA